MKINTYADLYKDPNYEKLVDPTRTAVMYRDKLIRIQYKNQDNKLCRQEILVQTNKVIETYQLKVDELRLDLADTIDILRDLVDNYENRNNDISLYNKRINGANSYLDNFANKYIGT